MDVSRQGVTAMKKTYLALLCFTTIFSCFFIASCKKEVYEKPAVVSGKVIYYVRMALADNAIVVVKIVQQDKKNSRSQLIAERRIKNPGPVPIPFIIEYNPSLIDENSEYLLEAEINYPERTVFKTMKEYPIITHGNPSTDLEVILIPDKSSALPTKKHSRLMR